MKPNQVHIGVALLAAALLSSGCKKEAPAPATTPDEKPTTAQRADPNAQPPPKPTPSTVATPATDKETADTTVKESSATAVPATKAGSKSPVKEKGACDRKKMAAEVLKEGKKVLAGVKLKASAVQSELLASMPLYKGKTVRIEGPIVGICQKAGCWSALRGPNGKALKLKVTDGVVDFRKLAKEGHYAVGEGVFTPTGPHGAQVKITGAMIGTTACE